MPEVEAVKVLETGVRLGGEIGNRFTNCQRYENEESERYDGQSAEIEIQHFAVGIGFA